MESVTILSPDDLLRLEELLGILGNEQLTMQPLEIIHIDLLQKLLLWPLHYVYPVLDILKNCVLRPNGTLILSSAPSFDLHTFVTSLQ